MDLKELLMCMGGKSKNGLYGEGGYVTAQNDCTSKNAVLSRGCEVLQRKSTPILHQVIRSKKIR